MVKKILIGIISGVICGMFASGGGLILVPTFTYLLNLNEKEARATSLFCILPMVIITAIIYNNNNLIDWNLGIKCAIGGIIGGAIGGKLLSKMEDKYLQIVYILFLIYAGINLIIK